MKLLERSLLVFIVAASALAGCLGSDEAERAPDPPKRVDSAARFSGQAAKVAQLLERWEQAVLADDARLICRQILAVKENRGFDDDNGGVRYCGRDEANSPAAILDAAGGAVGIDLVAEAISVERRPGGRLGAQARIRWGAGREEVVLRTSDEGEWRVVLRTFPKAWGSSARGRCMFESQRIVDLVAPERPADDPREAALQGVFAERAREVLRRGGSFELARISYRPDYSHLYVLRSSSGRLLSAFPVGVWGPRSYDASSVYFCRGGRLVGVIA